MLGGVRVRALHLAWLGLALTACEPGGRSLTVDLQSELMPGRDIAYVEVSLEGATTLPISPTLPGVPDGLRTPRRVAEFRGLSPGLYTVTVLARRAPATPDFRPDGGELVATRSVLVQLTGSRVVRVVLTASCVGRTCPLPGEDASLSQCFGGRCVDPRCEPGDGREACCVGAACAGLFCAIDADCAGLSSPVCAEPFCAEGVCLLREVEGECEAGTFCDLTARDVEPCRLIPRAPMRDAGVDAFIEPALDAHVESVDAWAADAYTRFDSGCSTASECDDHEVCTTDTCVSGSCRFTPRSEGTLCGGDGLPCTQNVCNAAGHCIHPAEPDGTVCDGVGICCSGSCINWVTNPNHCGSCDIRCASRTCAGGACTCDVNADCQPPAGDYGAAGTCFDDGTGYGARCQCVCNPSSAWRGTCGESGGPCPGSAYCRQDDGLNRCRYRG